MPPLAALGAIDDLAFRSGRDPSDDTAIGGCARRSSGTAGATRARLQVATANTPAEIERACNAIAAGPRVTRGSPTPTGNRRHFVARTPFTMTSHRSVGGSRLYAVTR
jgi:hypothetical protein